MSAPRASPPQEHEPGTAPGPAAAAPLRALPGFLAAFGFRAYRMLWTGAFLSSLGTWTQDVALSWLIHTRHPNPFYLGLRAFTAEAPLLAFMLVGGAVADRVDRRRILLTSQVLQMSFAAALLLLHAAGRLGIGAILGFAFLTGLAQSQSAPTYQAVVTSLVPPRHIPNAVALNSLQFNLSRAIGPAIAGILLVRAGTGACLAFNAASFLAVIVALWRIEIPSPRSGAESLASSLRAGLRHVMASRVLSTLTLLALGASFLAFPLVTYLPVIAGEQLRSGSAGYSLLLSSFGAGAILGAVLTAQRGRAPGRGKLMLSFWLAYGACIVGAVVCGRQGLAMLLLFVAGFCTVSAFSTLNSLVQEHAPDALRGRVLSIYGLCFRGGMPLGSLAAGALAGPFGAASAVGGFAAALALLAAVLRLRHRGLREL
jgi:predicted MFS family arabinose efflux permease